jgi:putative aldouronate transport system permease protein
MIHLTDTPDLAREEPPLDNENQGLFARLASRLNYRDRENTTFLIMTLPGLVLLFIFSYLPMTGIVIAFKNFKASQGLWGSEWVGFKNFEFLFTTDVAWRITRNTLALNLVFIVTSVIGSLVLALLLNEARVRILARFYQSAVFFPYFISWVIVGLFGYALLNADNGMINNLLNSVGLDTVNWYKEAAYWPAILTITNMWKGVGYWSIVYLAAILGIPPEYYEVAEIDGASRWKQIRYITLPLITPLIIINVLLSVGRIFYADFGMFYYVTRDSSLLYSTTDVIDTYVFRALRSMGDFSMAGAAGLYQSVVGFALIFGANWIVRRVDKEKSIF